MVLLSVPGNGCTGIQKRIAARVPISLRVTIAAVGVSLGGAATGLVSALVVPQLYSTVVSPETAFGEVLSNFIVQPGMGVFAAGYLWWRGNTEQALRVDRPSAEGLLWIATGPLAYEVLTALTRTVITAIGLESGGHHGGPATWEVLLANPVIILPALVVMFGLMAPMEELVYRGIIHAKLSSAFGIAGRVMLGATLFGLMHLILSSGVSSFLLTSVGGLVFATAYERTDNLLVPVAIHALYWLAT